MNRKIKEKMINIFLFIFSFFLKCLEFTFIQTLLNFNILISKKHYINDKLLQNPKIIKISSKVYFIEYFFNL